MRADCICYVHAVTFAVAAVLWCQYYRSLLGYHIKCWFPEQHTCCILARITIEAPTACIACAAGLQWSNQTTQPTPAPTLPTPSPTPMPTPVPASVPTPVPTPGGFNPYDPTYPGSRVPCVVLAGVNVKASALQQGLLQLRQAAAINPIACAIQCFAQSDCMFWLTVNSNCVQYGPAPTMMQLEAVSGQSSGAFRCNPGAH